MPDIYHSSARYLQFNRRNSMLMLAREPKEKLVVFVHGFGGHPLKTWSNFHTLLTTDDELKGFDLFFYHYDSKQVQSFVSGQLLDDILENILNTPNYFGNLFYREEDKDYCQRPSSFRYSRIIIVAHSLGAIVSRRAMLTGHEKAHQWPAITKLILFAPAHNGAKALLPIQMMLSFIPFLVGFKRFTTPTLDDVDLSSPNCMLEDLKERTRLLQLNSEGDCTIARKTVFALNDLVVNNRDYLKDIPAIIENYKDHGKLCKPTFEYMLPFDELKSFLLTDG